MPIKTFNWIIALTFLLSIPAIAAESEAGATEPASTEVLAKASDSTAMEANPENAKEAGLQELNTMISDLSNQIINEQNTLSDKVQKWIDRRRALMSLELQLSRDIKDQETQLETQRASLELMQLKLEEQKRAFITQTQRLNELKEYFAQKTDQAPLEEPIKQAVANE